LGTFGRGAYICLYLHPSRATARRFLIGWRENEINAVCRVFFSQMNNYTIEAPKRHQGAFKSLLGAYFRTRCTAAAILPHLKEKY
jgi:hypothetical protein